VHSVQFQCTAIECRPERFTPDSGSSLDDQGSRGDGVHSAHVPDPHEKTTIFYGWYSNRTRGYRKRQELGAGASALPPVVEDRAPLEVRRSWGRRIRQVYEVYPLHCPRCGGAVRVMAVIEQPAVIRQILEPLGLAIPSLAERPPPQLTRRLAVAEAPEWTDDPVDADLPLGDPLTV